MTKISQYSTDVNITGNDKWIGSDAQNFLITKNFTPNNLADFFNGNNVIDIGTSIRYRYQTLLPGEAREQGTISFETEVGPQVNFSDISTFLIAKNTLKGNTVTQYLDFLVDGKVLISKASNINIFGYYKITSIEPWIPNTNFFVVELEFLSGNGFIYEDLDYLVSLVDKVEGSTGTVWGSITGDIENQTDLINYISSQITTPTLQEVMEVGRSYIETIGDFTYTLDFFSDTLFLNVADSTLNTIYGIQLSQEAQLYYNDLTQDKASSVYANQDGVGLQSSKLSSFGTNVLKIPFKTSGSGNVVFKVQNNLTAGEYELATLDDIPTLQQVLDEGTDATVGNNTVDFNSTDSGGGIIFESRIGAQYSNVYIEEALLQLSCLNETSGKNGSLLIAGGNFSINQSNNDGTDTTTVIIEDPIADTTWIVPAKTAGNYEFASLDDIPTTSGIPHATASGTDTYTATITGVAAYNDADAYLIRFTNGNTTSATLNINGLGAITLYRNNDGPLIGGDIVSNGEMLCVYNSTLNVFQTIGTAPNTLLSYVTNADSVTITKGQVVYAFGGQGDRMTVKLASNTSDATSARTVGVVLSASIAANQKGLIMMQGLLDGLNILPTSTFADGDPIYLGATPGSITKVKPYAPNHLVYIATVTTASNGSAGRMYVNIQNGYELDELHNVQAQNPSLKDTLWYDNTVSPAQWKTASISTILGYTPLSSAIISLGGLTGATQTFATGTTGTNFGISSAGTTHTFNLPTASASNRGALSSSDWSTFNGKQRDLFEFNAKEGFYLYENFLGAGLIPSTISGWTGESSGAGSSIVTVNNYPNRTNQQGVLRLATGTATTGLAQGRLGDNNAGSHFLGNGVYTLQFFVNIETLSDVTNRFYSIFGATTNANFANTSGMFFIYDEGVGTYGAASPNWKCITRNGGTITSTITSVSVTASQWYVLRIVVNAGGTSIEFFIDGVSVATHTTNLPTLITPRIANVKTTGTTSRNAFVDYVLLQQVFTTPRPN